MELRFSKVLVRLTSPRQPCSEFRVLKPGRVFILQTCGHRPMVKKGLLPRRLLFCWRRLADLSDIVTSLLSPRARSVRSPSYHLITEALTAIPSTSRTASRNH